jgi:hypothetical protein
MSYVYQVNIILFSLIKSCVDDTPKLLQGDFLGFETLSLEEEVVTYLADVVNSTSFIRGFSLSVDNMVDLTVSVEEDTERVVELG